MSDPAVRCLYKDYNADEEGCSRQIYGDPDRLSKVYAYNEIYLGFLSDVASFDARYCDPELGQAQASRAFDLSRLQVSIRQTVPPLAGFFEKALWISGARACRHEDYEGVRAQVAEDRFGVWAHTLRQSFDVSTPDQVQEYFGIEQFDFARSASNEARHLTLNKSVARRSAIQSP